MLEPPIVAVLTAGLHVLVQAGLCVRVLLRPHRQPASRVAWIVVVISMPVVGILVYLLLGEVNLGRRRIERMRQVLSGLPAVPAPDSEAQQPDVPQRYEHLFRVASSINGFSPVGGNHVTLLPDSQATMDAMVRDIDAAQEHVHVLFYIWLTDESGLRIVAALRRAAARGVNCRALADGLGSRAMIRSEHWRSMHESGVRQAVALPVGRLAVSPLRGRIDLRNHRKIVVIDDWITYCGSQNCADPEFRVKAKFAPWVDAVMRFEGPVARQNQQLFASDWMAHVDEDLSQLLRRPLRSGDSGITAQVIGTGPTVRYSAMPEMFESLMYTARRELTVSTPYYVPDEPMQAALCAAARRGVHTSLIVPARNDSWIVAAASRSYYTELLAAGVHIYEFVGGLLHTKSLTLDGEIALIGSANMDRRSFELNYENNILLVDAQATAQLRARQQDYLSQSQTVTAEQVRQWPTHRRLWNNTIAMLSPVL